MGTTALGKTIRDTLTGLLRRGIGSVDEVEKEMGWKRGRVRARLNDLVYIGRAVRVAEDQYALSPSLVQPAVLAQEKEQKPMVDEPKHETTCIGCIRKEFELQNKDRDLANAKAESERYKAEAAQVTSATSQVKALQDEVQTLTEQVQTAGNLPTVKDFLTHCESGNCAQHAQEWAAVKKDLAAQFLEGLTPEIVQAKAQEMDLIPRKITIKGIDSLLGGQHGAA